ncbi:3'-5' exonuclease [Conoideocrella luteorostrata]|uniref:RNA exonuclease 4 n=1 Tax=Conoideocrella luteorostrata TaxID=1105319 RepID=A0AAJ0CKI9_9HYPO|nr:3'-5' exonuclease [Conoideocrella luteorostrata]
MAELSSNWRKLQATLQGNTKLKPSVKRKVVDEPSHTFGTQHISKKRSRGNFHPSEDQTLAPRMGGAHSSKLSNETYQKTSPSVGLWAKDSGISSEAIAEAYGLGIKGNSMMAIARNDKVNHGKSQSIDLGKYVAVDCEMVGIGSGGHQSTLARVSLVDFHGRQVYDSYVIPKERVTDWRSSISGISPKEMRFARGFDEVQNEVSRMIQGRVLVGHDIKHDLDALKLSHPPKDVRDTARHQGFRKFGNGPKPALRILAQELLGINIQETSHSSTEDARVTMLLFRKYKSNFDVDYANRYSRKSPPVNGGKLKSYRKRR